MRMTLILVAAVVTVGESVAQQSTFSPADLFSAVAFNHPLARQADLRLSQARQSVLEARGAFDPYLKGALDRKYFNDKDYYTMLSTSVEVPTWFGITAKAGYDLNNGAFIDQSDQLPQAGLAYLGLSVPLGRGLFLDERRTALRTAQLSEQRTLAERDMSVNDLYMRVADDYAVWAQRHADAEVLRVNYEVALERYGFVSQMATVGEMALIDTAEAAVQVAALAADLERARANLEVAALRLSNHLWDAEGRPLVLSPEATPLSIGPEKALIPEPANTAFNPTIRVFGPLQAQNRLDRRAVIERFKPIINLNYNLLTAGTMSTDGGFGLASLSGSNYKVGIDVRIPLALRGAAGALRRNRLQAAELEVNLARVQRERQMSGQQADALITAAWTQWTEAERMVLSQQRLVDAENERFRLGETNLMTVNLRQQRLVELQLRVNDLRYRWVQAVAQWAWADGRPETWAQVFNSTLTR